MTSARASATRCCSPPDSDWMPGARRRRQSHASERSSGAGDPPVRRNAARLEAERDVLLDRHVREERVVLKHHAEAAPLGRQPRDVLPVEFHPAFVGRSYPAAMRSVVVFPDPDAPTSARNSPSATMTATWSRRPVHSGRQIAG